jgi:hypothetical protein
MAFPSHLHAKLHSQSVFSWCTRSHRLRPSAGRERYRQSDSPCHWPPVIKRVLRAGNLYFTDIPYSLPPARSITSSTPEDPDSGFTRVVGRHSQRGNMMQCTPLSYHSPRTSVLGQGQEPWSPATSTSPHHRSSRGIACHVMHFLWRYQSRGRELLGAVSRVEGCLPG